MRMQAAVLRQFGKPPANFYSVRSLRVGLIGGIVGYSDKGDVTYGRKTPLDSRCKTP